MSPHKVNVSRRLLRTAIGLCLAAICLASIGMAFAKYHSEANAHDSANAALFSPSLISENNIDISGIKKPGDSTEKTFKVQNFSGDSVSEVTMKYTISLKTTGNLPLCFTLLDADGNSLGVWICNGMNGQREYKYESPTVFSPGVNETHGYRLKAEWPAGQNGAQFAGMTDAVYLSVIWEQVD